MIDWDQLSTAAWDVREKAYVLGKTKVGAAVLAEDRRIFVGCNVEHRFRSHDVHAEVNAIGNMIAAGGQRVVGVLVVADRELFTPCGACMDWIFQFGGAECRVAFQRAKGQEPTTYTASLLMPYYPR